jgi:hypothetical protein
MSDDGDLLPQLVNYGDIAVGFAAKDLVRLHPNAEEDYAIWPERYDTEMSATAVSAAYHDAIEMMNVQYQGDWDVTAAELRDRMGRSEYMGQFMARMAHWCGQIKQPGWTFQRERRAIRFTPSNIDNRESYRETPLGPAPYVKFDVTDPTSTPRRPLIRRIVCGPPGVEEKVATVKSLLAEFGYEDGSVEVVASATPLRRKEPEAIERPPVWQRLRRWVLRTGRQDAGG